MKALGFTALITLATIILPFSSQAGFFFESRNTIVDGEVTPLLNFYNTHDINKKVQVFAYCMIGKTYCEGYSGLAYSPRSWLQIGAGGGMETADSPWRIATFLWAGKGPVSAIAYYEYGGSGYWWLGKATYTINKTVTAGILGNRFTGVGPLVEISIPKTHFKIWGLPAYDFEDDTQKTVLGISLNL